MCVCACAFHFRKSSSAGARPWKRPFSPWQQRRRRGPLGPKPRACPLPPPLRSPSPALPRKTRRRSLAALPRRSEREGNAIRRRCCLGNLERKYYVYNQTRVGFLSLDFLYYFVRIDINIVVEVITRLPVFKPVCDYKGPLVFFVLFKKYQIQSIKLKHRNAHFHTQPKNVCKTFFFLLI